MTQFSLEGQGTSTHGSYKNTWARTCGSLWLCCVHPCSDSLLMGFFRFLIRIQIECTRGNTNTPVYEHSGRTVITTFERSFCGLIFAVWCASHIIVRNRVCWRSRKTNRDNGYKCAQIYSLKGVHIFIFFVVFFLGVVSEPSREVEEARAHEEGARTTRSQRPPPDVLRGAHPAGWTRQEGDRQEGEEGTRLLRG